MRQDTLLPHTVGLDKAAGELRGIDQGVIRPQDDIRVALWQRSKAPDQRVLKRGGAGFLNSKVPFYK